MTDRDRVGPPREVFRAPLRSYAVAVLAVALATLIKWLLDPVLGAGTPFLFFFAAVLVGAWYGGLLPGLLATALAALVSVAFFLEASPASRMGDGGRALRLAIFAGEGILISLITEALHRSRRRAQAGAREAAALAAAVHQQETTVAARARLATFAAEVGAALTRPEPLVAQLESCAQAIVRHLDAAFARIWTLDPVEPVLILQASAGQYTHRDGPHGRVPVGEFKIGQIAQERRPHLTNAVIGDPRVSDQEWARREGMVAFAGYPLLVADRLVGVMALFARRPLGEEALAAMASVADTVAIGIERRRVEDAIVENEARLREIFTRAPALIAVLRGPEHRVEFANAAFLRASGDREVIGRPFGLAYPELAALGYLRRLDRVYARGETAAGSETPLRLDRGGVGEAEPIFLDWRYEPLRDAAGRVSGVFIHVVDVTAHVRARRQVEALAAERAAVLSQTAEGVIVADAQGRLTLVNEAARRMHGVAELGVPVEAYSDAYHLYTMAGEPYPPEELPLARAVQRGETVTGAQWRIRRPDGSEIVAEGSATPVSGEDGARLGSVLVIRDVTAQVELGRQKDAFLASASHDLKNPLAPIKGIAQIFLRQLDRTGGVDPERLREGLTSIDLSVGQMVEVLDSLLDVARLRMGQGLALQLAPADLVALAREAVGRQAQASERHQVRLETAEAALAGRFDAARLRRALNNLLGNAVKYSPEGGAITVAVRRDAARPGWAILAVTDEGVGIPAADLDRVFRRFERGANVAGRIAGTGIGLADVRQVVEQHGGEIELTSTEGAGTTVTAYLPLTPPGPDDGPGGGGR